MRESAYLYNLHLSNLTVQLQTLRGVSVVIKQMKMKNMYIKQRITRAVIIIYDKM